MSGYEIGISGLHAAQNALEIVGNNLANAATEGYHRQKVELRPRDEVYTNGHLIGQGVDMTGIKRLVNKLLDGEIVNQESTLAQLEKELEALTTVESAFAELTTSAMSTAMDDFFNAMHSLSANPNDVNMQSLVGSGAESLCNLMRNLGSVVTELEDLALSEAQSTIEDVNVITEQIAELNEKIKSLSVRGHDVSNMLDQRDQLITELSRLIGITTYEKDDNVVDVVVGDVTVVLGNLTTNLDVGLVVNGSDYDLGVTAAGQNIYNTNLTGGRIGGLLSLRNSIVRDISTSLDTLALTIIKEINHLHVQGVGTAGSFDRLTGWTMTETDVANMIPPVTGGSIFIRVTDSTGAVTRYEVAVDQATSTLSSVAADFAAIPGLDLNTAVNSGRLQIVANPGYTFDFLPGALAEPSGYPGGPLAGGPAGEAPPNITITGTYTGTANQTYTCTVNTTPPGATCAIGSDTMELTIVDGSGVTVARLNIGQGYTGGTGVDSILAFDNGLKISFSSNGSSPGYLNDGEQFEIQALANSDTSGFLSAVGINTFFSGVDATSMAVNEDVQLSGTKIAVFRSVEQSVGANALEMAKLGDTTLTDLAGMDPKSYYRDLATDVGNEIAVANVRYDNAHGVWRSLLSQRSDVSGVDMNDEAAQMLVYERMFQAMAKYMNTVTDTLDMLMSIAS
ncbi:MAG: flagellar hook-associated protein FlgK [Sedimentisphaerales bacterium]|nr:flagellar hook-associated protein FlgK [Sedimentisphaerales bacterium]